MERKLSSSTSGSDRPAKHCELVNRQERICQCRCGRTLCSCKSPEVLSSPDRGECSTRSRRESTPTLSVNTSTVSRGRDDDSSPELRKREWLPFSSIQRENWSLGCTKTRSSRPDLSYSDVDTPVKKEVRANYRREYVSPDQCFSLSDNRKRISAKKKNESSSIFKLDTEITSRKGHSSSGKQRTRSIQHIKQANNCRHPTLRCNSSSPDIRLSTSFKNHNSSLLSNIEISVQTKHRKAETHSPSSTESSSFSSLEDLAPSSRSVEKKCYSRSNVKKRPQRSSKTACYTKSPEHRRTHGTGMKGSSSSSAGTSDYLSTSDSRSSVNSKMSRSDRHSLVNRTMSRSDRHSLVNRTMSRSDRHSLVNRKMSSSDRHSLVNRTMSRSDRHSLVNRTMSRSDRHSLVNRTMSRSDRHSLVNRTMSRSDRHSLVNRKMSRSDRHSLVNSKMSRSDRHSLVNRTMSRSDRHSLVNRTMSRSDRHSLVNSKMSRSDRHSLVNRTMSRSDRHSLVNRTMSRSDRHSLVNSKMLRSDRHSLVNRTMSRSDRHSLVNRTMSRSDRHSLVNRTMSRSDRHSLVNRTMSSSDRHSLVNRKMSRSDRHSLVNRTMSSSDRHSLVNRKMSRSDRHSLVNRTMSRSDRHSLVNRKMSRSDRHSLVIRTMSSSDRHSLVNRKMSRSDRHSLVNRKMSRSDRHSPANHKMSRSGRGSPDRYEQSNENIVSPSKNRAQFPTLYDTDFKKKSGDFKLSLTNTSQSNYAFLPDRKHLQKDNGDRRSNKNRPPRRQGPDYDYKPKVNKRDSDYMKVHIAVKRQRSPDFPSSSDSSSECDDFENAGHLQKRRRLNESESCDQTHSNKMFMKTKVCSVAVMPKKSHQDRHTDRHDFHLQADSQSNYHKQRYLGDNLLESCCQHSDDAWNNLKGKHDVDDSRSLFVKYGRKGASGTTSGRNFNSPQMATLQTPTGHHLEGSPRFSSPSFIAKLSPRSTLKGLDQPHPWALDLVARSQTYRGTFIDSHCHIDLIYDRLNLSHQTRFSDFRKMVAHSFPDNFEGCVAVFCYPKTYDPINPQNQLFTTLAHDDGVWFAIGCHPKSATEFTDRHEKGLRKALRQSKVVALGEIGLDYSGTFYRHAETQKIVLRKQVKMALEMKLPLVLHCRDAYDDCLVILMQMVPRNWPIHLHCFCGNPDTANIWLQTFTNLYIGLTPVITYRTAHDSINTARNIPLSRLLLETDSPYFVPGNIPKGRSSVSHPGFALFTAERIAQIKNVSVDTVLQTCRANTKNVYSI